MPPLRPQQWLIYSPVTILPLLAALVLEGPALQARVETGVRASLNPSGTCSGVKAGPEASTSTSAATRCGAA